MFRLLGIACLISSALCANIPSEQASKDWYKNVLVYQIYPRSFKDSNGDGVGDLNGITSKLEHIADIGADVLWLSPIFTSPQVDFGYDIANFTDIDPDYGNLGDFSKLMAKAKSLGLKVLLDFVPNHSSHEHEWFKKSVERIKPYDEYYVWRDAKVVNGRRYPPNNWLCAFQGSAWEWNPTREQYYLHQFATGQPDLNYRSAALNEEMKKVLTFWLDRGVDGFRIDAINVMFEDPRFLDEPVLNRTDLPAGDYETLDHIYTKDLNETYDVLRTWRKLLDDHSAKNNGDTKIILTEAYTNLQSTVKYYTSGSNVPFNFMYIADLKNASRPVDFKRATDRWLNNVPSGPEYVANWVVGNHDNHRAATRFGPRRTDQLNMLATILPGITVIYNGDEIGMVDREFTYKETVDPAGCNAGPNRYHLKSRDPERTPFQWDNSTSAGFSTSTRTWLPVHSNYKTLNLAAQKLADKSHYKVFKRLTALKKKPIIERGSVQVTLVTRDCLGVVRRLGTSTVVLLVNFSKNFITVDAATWLNVPETMIGYVASVERNLEPGFKVDMTYVILDGFESTVFITQNV